MTPLCDIRRFLLFARTQEAKPYLWGAKGPMAFDCSGLVTWALWKAGGPDWRETHNSDALWRALQSAETVKDGEVALAFYGRPRPTHVMVVVGDGRVFGACGGDSSTTTIEAARLRKACVRYRRSFGYRPDFIGFRLLEVCLPEPAP